MLLVSEQFSTEILDEDMKFPIDTISLDSNGAVVHNEHIFSALYFRSKPSASILNCPKYTCDNYSEYVLETLEGFCQKYNVKIGANIDFYLVSLL
jgi:uncharacterized membrane protein (UPF0127 family)